MKCLYLVVSAIWYRKVVFTTIPLSCHIMLKAHVAPRSKVCVIVPNKRLCPSSSDEIFGKKNLKTATALSDPTWIIVVCAMYTWACTGLCRVIDSVLLLLLHSLLGMLEP